MSDWHEKYEMQRREVEEAAGERFKSGLGRYAYESYASPDEARAGTAEIRLGSQLGDLLCGLYDFTGLSHENRVLLLHDIATIHSAVMNMGWHEHTGDWDWRIVITWKDDEGTLHEQGTHDNTGEIGDDDYIDYWSDNYQLMPPADAEKSQIFSGEFTARRMGWGYEAYTACVDAEKITHIVVDEYSDGERQVEVEIDRITSLNIWYDT